MTIGMTTGALGFFLLLLPLTSPAQEIIHAVTVSRVETNWNGTFPTYVEGQGHSPFSSIGTNYFWKESGFIEHGTVCSNLYAVIDWKGQKKQVLLDSTMTHYCIREYTVENVKHWREPKFTALNYSTTFSTNLELIPIGSNYIGRGIK